MKKLSSVWFMWFAFGFGVISVLLMFTPHLHASAGRYSGAQVFFNTVTMYKGAWPSFVGYMLILVGALALGILALPFVQPSVQQEKIVLISSISALVIGSLLVMLISVWFSIVNNNNSYDVNVYPLAGTFVAGGFALLAATSGAIALKKDW